MSLGSWGRGGASVSSSSLSGLSEASTGWLIGEGTFGGGQGRGGGGSKMGGGGGGGFIWAFWKITLEAAKWNELLHL